jgi:hypothetical protein
LVNKKNQIFLFWLKNVSYIRISKSQIFNIMKKSIFIFIVAAGIMIAGKSFSSAYTLGGKISTHVNEWVQFKSDDYKCQISFPAEFKEESKDKQVSAQVTVSGKIFMFFADKVAGADGTNPKFADEAVKTFAKSMKAKVKKENAYTFNEFKGKKAVIYMKEQKMYAHYIVIIGKEILYQIVVVTSSEAPDEDVATFSKSFAILK